MRIAIATVQVPFTTGGAEILTGMFKDELIKRGHKAEIVSIPFKWSISCWIIWAVQPVKVFSRI